MMNFKRHQIPQILGEIKEILEKNIIEEEPKKPYFTYEISKFILENIDSNPKVIILESKFIVVHIKDNEYIEKAKYPEKCLGKFKELIDKLNIKIDIGSHQQNNHTIYFPGNMYAVQKYSIDELKEYFTSIDKIPDQMFDFNQSYEHFYQIIDTLLLKRRVADIDGRQQQKNIQYPEQVKQVKELLNKYNYKYYYYNEQYNYYAFCKELDKKDIQNEEILHTVQVSFKSKSKIEVCYIRFALRDKIYTALKTITDDFLNMIFGNYELIQNVEQCDKILKDEYKIIYLFTNIQPTYYISNYIKQHYQNIPIRYERVPYSTDTYYIVIDVEYDNGQTKFKELENLLNVDSILIDNHKHGIMLNIKTTNRQIIPAIDDIPDLFFISQYSVNGKTYSRSPLLDQYEQTMYNNARNSFMKQVKEIYDKYDSCFIFNEDQYIEFINKNQLQGIQINTYHGNKFIQSGIFEIKQFDEFKNNKDRKPATFEQVQNLLQKYLDDGYIVQDNFLKQEYKKEEPKQQQFTYEISKFILENIDPNPEIDNFGDMRISIKVKHSKYYYKDSINHEPSQQYEFKYLLDKLNIYLWWANMSNKQYDLISLNEYTGKHSYDEFKQYFTSIDKIPDQLYNRTIWYDHYDQKDQDYFDQLIDTLLEQQPKKEKPKKKQPKPTYHIAQWFKDNNISGQVVNSTCEGLSIYLDNNTYNKYDQLEQYLLQFDDVLEQKADKIVLNQSGLNGSYLWINTTFRDKFQRLPTIYEIPDQLLINHYYQNGKGFDIYKYKKYYLHQLIEQLNKTKDHKIFIANKQFLVIDDKLITLMRKSDDTKITASKPFKITSINEHFGEEYAKQFQEINVFDLTNMILCDCVNREIIEKLLNN